MNFSEILTKSRSENDSVRNQAERDLDTLAVENFGGLLEDCAIEMSNESSKKENRQLCGTLIKNMILFQEKHKGKWEQLDQKLKSSIKDHVISCLASNVKDIRKAAASTVAGKLKIKFRYL
jgi:hypothetical protein